MQERFLKSCSGTVRSGHFSHYVYYDISQHCVEYRLHLIGLSIMVFVIMMKPIRKDNLLSIVFTSASPQDCGPASVHIVMKPEC